MDNVVILYVMNTQIGIICNLSIFIPLLKHERLLMCNTCTIMNVTLVPDNLLMWGLLRPAPIIARHFENLSISFVPYFHFWIQPNYENCVAYIPYC